MTPELGGLDWRPQAWDHIRAFWERSARTGLDDAVGRWAFDVLEAELGPGWVALCEARNELPPELLMSAGSLHDFGMLVDLAAALDVLRAHSGMGDVRRIVRTNPAAHELAAVRCALRLAASAEHADLRAVLEAGEPPVDLVIDDGSRPVLVEIKAVFRPDITREVDSWLMTLLAYTSRIMGDDICIEGAASKSLDDAATETLAERLADAARLVRLGLEAAPVQVGRNRFEVTLAIDGRRPGSHIGLPSRDLWMKLRQRLGDVMRQAQRSGATWAVIDSQDDFWLLTPWSQLPFEDQAVEFGRHVRREFAAQTALDGVIVTDGGRHTDLTTTDSTVETTDGVLGVRRRLDRGRVRSAIVVTLSDRGAAQAALWRTVFDVEPAWVGAALARAGLGVPPALALLPDSPS